MMTERAQATWSEVLRQLKAKHGTYAEIGAALAVHEQSVQGWVTGGKLPNIWTERRIALALSLDYDGLHAALDQLRTEKFLQRLERHPLAPVEVGGRPAPFRGQETGGGSPPRRKPRPADAGPAARLKRLRRRGLTGLITAATLFLAPAPARAVTLEPFRGDDAPMVGLLSSRRRRLARTA